MKARHLCAVAGVAIAVGTVVFMQSLVASNDHQAFALANRLLEENPIPDDAQICTMAVDYRPNGKVMQGPPMMAMVATRGMTDIAPGECVATEAFFAQRRLPVPKMGTELTFVGRNGAYKLKLVSLCLASAPIPPVRGYPNMFVTDETMKEIGEQWTPWTPKTAEELAPGFMSDAGRHFDMSKGLLLWAAALTALCLLLNSLCLSIEAQRRDIAILRMLGLTRGGVIRRVLAESLALTAAGCALGTAVAVAAVYLYVAADRALFPMGAALLPRRALAACAAVALLVAVAAALFALKPALAVKPLEAASARWPRKKHVGMLVAFACGFGAFVAVEVWGASLMSAFVPSPEWPDAIVSILPGGVSSFDVDKLQSIDGVARIAELQPLQVNLDPLEELKGPGGGERGDAGGRGGRGRGPAYRNALLLASGWLPKFRFTEGDWETASRALGTGDTCVITEMMAHAKGLHLGDALKLDCGRDFKRTLTIVGVVDLNWHMVTSRGLVRGLNRMPVQTDGPVFVSFDTLAACDARPQPFVNMTHLWLDYTPEFLARHGAFAAGRLVEKRIVAALDGAYNETEDGEVRGNTVRLHARDEVADGTLAHGHEIIGSMARVPFIFIAVLSLGFVAMIVASADARRREFRVLRAVGATRAYLARVLAQEALAVAALGLVLGLVGGTVAGVLFTIPTRAIWSLPVLFALPVATVAKGAAGAVACALAVAVPTALAVVREERA